METPAAVQTPQERRSFFGPALVLLGGLLVVVSGLTDWAQVAPPATLAGPITVKGSGIVVVVGVVLLVLGVAMGLIRSRGARIALAVVAIVAGLVAALITGVSIGSKDVLISTAADKYAETSPASKTRIENALKDLNHRGQLDINIKIGLWLGLAGGILVLVGGIGGIAGSGKGAATARPGGMPYEPARSGAPAPPIPGAAPQAPNQPGPDIPQGGGVGPSPGPPVPPAGPPIEGEPGTSPEYRP
ncbi:MAG: hypothetical protein ABR600_14610 [Actinomycetota bacterium]